VSLFRPFDYNGIAFGIGLTKLLFSVIGGNGNAFQYSGLF
jgi:hypothetical protein